MKTKDIPALLDPWYLQHSEARDLRDAGLLVYNEGQEQYEHTAEGAAMADNIRALHRMTWDGTILGGGRWVVGTRELHCGDLLQVMLADGTWRYVRFEVEFSGDAAAQATGGRIPALHLAVAGTSSLVCRLPPDQHPLFRWPKES
ncbi:hypothetical protein LCGC14_2373510 [marine sediment metagenome]|uniref:Uncharacterized protein n=1 Tax=marine sediment metagenome TaxID=412755 RepID=A0A0F9EFF0_9ZZZZ